MIEGENWKATVYMCLTDEIKRERESGEADVIDEHETVAKSSRTSAF